MKADANKDVRVECEECGATGVYTGYAEAVGHGVECRKCKGSGFLTFTLFTNRKQREDVNFVKVPAIENPARPPDSTEPVPPPATITYAVFLTRPLPG